MWSLVTKVIRFLVVTRRANGSQEEVRRLGNEVDYHNSELSVFRLTSNI